MYTLLDEIDRRLGGLVHEGDPVGVERVLAVRVDRSWPSLPPGMSGDAGSSRRGGHGLCHLSLPFQGLEVMGHAQQVDLGGEFVRRVAPVAVGKGTELAAVDQTL